MRLLPNKTRERLPHLMATLAFGAAVLGCLALGARTLLAGGGDPPLEFGGGDAIGSLPFSAPPPEYLVGGPSPSIVLEGPSLAAINALVIDAYANGSSGDAWVEVIDMGEDSGVRVEIQGHVTVVLDRNAIGAFGISTGLDVSQGFSGGLGILTQNNRPVRTQILPAEGDLALPLVTLANSGALDTGILTFHSVSVEQHHHLLQMSCSGGTLRLVSGN